MNYTPRYAQPFTLEQAILLDVPVITEEIARLENSLARLKSTQEMLREHLSMEESEPDPELSEALAENELVIGSQEERIGILKIALTHKGITTSAHYDTSTPPPTATRPPAPVNGVNGASETHNGTEDDDEGVYL